MEDNKKTQDDLQDRDMMKSYYKRLLSKSESETDDDSSWMLTMSDVMSLLLVFLIMFFIMTKNSKGSDSSVPEDKPAASVSSEEPSFKELARDEINEDRYKAPGVEEQIKEEIVSEIRNLELDDQVYVAATNREIMITMKEKVTFNPGEARILEGTEPILKNIADVLSRYPQYLVIIEGHTDNVPISTARYPSNWELSVARATSVLKFFINEYGVDPSILSIKGNADKKPVAPNDTVENRAKNRRVEIRLTKIDA